MITTTRSLSDIRLTKNEINMVKEAAQRNSISGESRIEFLFWCDAKHFEFGNVFGGESTEITNSRLDAQARKFKKAFNL